LQSSPEREGGGSVYAGASPTLPIRSTPRTESLRPRRRAPHTITRRDTGCCQPFVRLDAALEMHTASDQSDTWAPSTILPKRLGSIRTASDHAFGIFEIITVPPTRRLDRAGFRSVIFGAGDRRWGRVTPQWVTGSHGAESPRRSRTGARHAVVLVRRRGHSTRLPPNGARNVGIRGKAYSMALERLHPLESDVPQRLTRRNAGTSKQNCGPGKPPAAADGPSTGAKVSVPAKLGHGSPDSSGERRRADHKTVHVSSENEARNRGLKR